MRKLNTFLFVLFVSLAFSTQSFSQAEIFTENFDSYTAGNFVACSNPSVWTTWSNAPCGSEDALVSNEFAFSSPNSAKVVTNNDLVKKFGTTAFTSGKYKISFQVYIPATKAGYFNTLANFAGGSSTWAMEMYFDANGTIRVNPSGAVPVSIPNGWTADQWHLVEHVVDLDTDLGQVYFDGVMIQSQQYTLGAYTTAVTLTLDANDFFGATANDVMYFDDYTLTDMLATPPPIFFDNFDSYTAGLLVACQNPIDWTTWSNAPCGPEDAEVSNAYAYSGANSAKIVTNDDFVKPLGNKTTGKWYMSFMYYIPATKSGYFNTMNVFTLPGTFVWGMDVYFDAGGAGRIDTTGGGGVPATTVNFTWSVAQWNQAIVIVDLDTQIAEFWTGTNPLNLTQVATWNWTQGGTKPNSLAVNDFFGATATDELYIDDYFFSDEMPTIIPVELSAFAANVVGGAVVLNWTTESELNNQGFEIERRTAEGQFVTIGSVQGNGTTTERRQYSYTDAGVETGNYYYRLKQIDFGGAYEYSNEIFVDVTAPLEFALDQNYPNPFNPTTTINFSLAEPTFVKLAIYNLLGEEVEVLKNEYMNAGSFNVSFDATSLPSGMYLYKVETAQFSSVRKMMLMK